MKAYTITLEGTVLVTYRDLPLAADFDVIERYIAYPRIDQEVRIPCQDGVISVMVAALGWS